MRRLTEDYKNIEISNATLLTEDLLENFLWFLRDVSEECQIILRLRELEEEINKLRYEDGRIIDDDIELADILLNEDCFYLLNDISPIGTYFGSHQGDGACFGFWEQEEELD